MASKESSAREMKVPVLCTDNNLIEQEFDSIREKFEIEMGKMEEEMAKFRTQLLASERNRLAEPSSIGASSGISASLDQQQQRLKQRTCEQRIASSSVTRTSKRSIQTSTESSSSLKREEQQAVVNEAESTLLQAGSSINKTSEQKDMTMNKNWLQGFNSPLIKESDAGKILKLQFDVSPYEPEQILVRTLDNRLQVHAKREEKSQNRSMYREYNREFLLPEGTNTQLIKSSLSADGVLTVEAPIPANLYQTQQHTEMLSNLSH